MISIYAYICICYTFYDVNLLDVVTSRVLLIPQELDRLLSREIDVNLADDRGKTPLMEAAYRGHQGCVRQLLKHGADVNRRDNRGWSATMHAAYRGYVDCLELLVLSGADLDLEDIRCPIFVRIFLWIIHFIASRADFGRFPIDLEVPFRDLETLLSA